MTWTAQGSILSLNQSLSLISRYIDVITALSVLNDPPKVLSVELQQGGSKPGLKSAETSLYMRYKSIVCSNTRPVYNNITSNLSSVQTLLVKSVLVMPYGIMYRKLINSILLTVFQT